MLELFEKVFSTNAGAGKADWEKLFKWMTEQGFPNSDFPEDYVSLMSESNGGIYMTGEREYQVLALREAADYYEAYEFAEFMPFAYPFAMDGCGNFYILNLKEMDGKVYGVSAGNLGWLQDECFPIANSLSECFKQVDVLDKYMVQ